MSPHAGWSIGRHVERRRARRGMKVVLVACAFLCAGLVYSATASATLKFLQPTPDASSTFSGNGGYSADGLGENTPGGVLRAEVPAGSTVVQAYLYGTFTGGTPAESDRTIDLDGTNVVLQPLPDVAPGCCGLAAARADVTAQVAGKVGGGGGITTFVVGNDPSPLEGVALLVIYSNPNSPFVTIGVFDGGAEQAGDSTSFTFAGPLDPSTPGFAAQMSLGIGFGFQGDPGHTCGTGGDQSSTVDVNGARLTSCAGNFDDGVGNNGALITVGGVGDSLDNPDNPNQLPGDGTTPRTTDDELYNLVPFIHAGDQQLKIDTKNASVDDNVFLVVVEVTAAGCATTNGTCVPPSASVAGTVYNDANANGSRDGSEGGRGGVTVFADLNHNGAQDNAEPSAVSAADGTYQIANVPPGNQSIMPVSPAGSRCTQPVPCSYALTLHDKDAVTGKDFGEAPPPASQACVDKRRFTFKLHHGPRSRVVKVEVFIDGKRVMRQRGKNLKSLTLKKAQLPKTFHTVKIVVTLSNKSSRVSKRVYLECTKGKPKIKSHHHRHHHKKHKKH